MVRAYKPPVYVRPDPVPNWAVALGATTVPLNTASNETLVPAKPRTSVCTAPPDVARIGVPRSGTLERRLVVNGRPRNAAVRLRTKRWVAWPALRMP